MKNKNRIICYIYFLLCQILLLANQKLEEKKDFEKIGQVFLSALPDQKRKAQPWIALGKKLYFSFDIFTDTETLLRYQIIHCHPDWTSSELSENTFLTGFNNSYFYPEQKKYAENNFLHYLHYQLEIPNSDLALKISGNYILRVYENDPEKPLIQKRFVIYETNWPIQIEKEQRYVSEHWTDILQIKAGIEQAIYPQNMFLALMQNGDWRNYKLTKPQINPKNKEIIFTFFNRENEFIADGLFFTLDLRSWQMPSVQREKIFKNQDTWEYYLRPHERLYLGNPEKDSLQGRFLIENPLKSEYIKVFFTMNSLPHQDIYLYGELTQWQILPEFRMQVQRNYQYQNYAVPLILKEGVYSYTFIYEKKEGFFEKYFSDPNNNLQKNDYQVFLFYQNHLENFYRIQGFGIDQK